MAGGIFGVPPHLLMKNAGCPSMSLLPRFGPRGWNDCDVAIVSSVMLVCPVPSSGREMVIPPTLLQCIVSMVLHLDSLLEAVALDAAARGLPSSVATLTLSLMSPLCFPACCLVAGGMLLSGQAPAAHTGGTSTIKAEARVVNVFCAGVLLAPGHLPAAQADHSLF